MLDTQKNPRRGRHSPGVILCLLALAVTVKPLADVVGDYTRCDGHKKIAEIFHTVHLLSVARLEKGSGDSIAQFGMVRQSHLDYA